MNVASRSLCKELYDLSGWGRTGKHTVSDVQIWWVKAEDVSSGIYFVDDGEWVVSPSILSFNDGAEYFPAYDLGYLFRKVQVALGVGVRFVDPDNPLATDLKEWHGKYIAFNPWLKQRDYAFANTPEDALCKLAIWLFQREVLIRRDRDEEV